MTTISQQCETRFGKLDSALAAQATALTQSTAAIQDQFRSFGQELMQQIIKMKNEPLANSKKRRGEGAIEEEESTREPAAPMDGVVRHEGGMEAHPYQPDVLRLASQLVAVINGEVSDATSSSSSSSFSMRPSGTAFRQELDHERRRTATATLATEESSSGAREHYHDDASAVQEDQVQDIEEPVRAPVENDVYLPLDTPPEASAKGAKLVPEQQPHDKPQDPTPLELIRGMRCSIVNGPDIAAGLASTWQQALRDGKHIWVLSHSGDCLADVDELVDIPCATRSPHPPGYHIMCWACGLVFAARGDLQCCTTAAQPLPCWALELTCRQG